MRKELGESDPTFSNVENNENLENDDNYDLIECHKIMSHLKRTYLK